MYTRKKEAHNYTKKAERKAAGLTSSRSDRWHANFFKKVRVVRFRSRSAAAKGRTAAGSTADFCVTRCFFETTVSGVFVLMCGLNVAKCVNMVYDDKNSFQGAHMAGEDSQFQLVTFQLGDEIYGVDIMDVKEIVKIQDVRPIPNAPYYVEGIINLRGEIIPIIDLHKRFRLKSLKDEDIDPDIEGGFIILSIENNKIGIIIDRVARVVSVTADDIKDPPQMFSGIGSEYIQGVIRADNGTYLIMLDIRKLFNPKELQKIVDF